MRDSLFVENEENISHGTPLVEQDNSRPVSERTISVRAALIDNRGGQVG
jgi:hypothetical protein